MVSLILTHSLFGIILLFLLLLLAILMLNIPISSLNRGIFRIWPLLILTFGLHLFVSGRGMVSFDEISALTFSNFCRSGKSLPGKQNS
jgi:hypothetical protein